MNSFTEDRYYNRPHSGLFSGKKAVYSLFFTVILLFFSDAFFPSGLRAAKKKASSPKLTITGSSWTIHKDGYYILKLNHASGSVTWSVSNKSMASIKKKSAAQIALTPKKKGSVTVKAVYKNKTYRKKLTIKGARLTSSSTAFPAGTVCKLKLNNATKKGKTIKWSVTNTKLASVKKNTKTTASFSAKLTGKVKVKARYNDITYTKKITIQPVLTAYSLNFNSQNSQKLKLKGVASSAAYTVKTWKNIDSTGSGTGKIYWAIENPLIVSITPASTGQVTVTPRAAGTTNIAVKYCGYKYTCQVTVGDIFPSKPEPTEEEKLDLPDLVLPEDIPSYWKEDLARAVASVENNRKLYGDMSSFFFLTDPHWYRVNGQPVTEGGSTNAGHSPAIINYLTDLIHPFFTMIGGDIISGIYKISDVTTDDGAVEYPDDEAVKKAAIGEINDFYAQFSSKVTLLSTVGNHDTNSNNTTSGNENTDRQLSVHDLYFSMILPSVGFAQTSYDSLESYVDDEAHKVRYISFFWDGIHYQDVTDKYDWIDTKVSELDEGWTVVFFTHAYWQGAILTAENGVSDTSKKIARHLTNLDAASKADIALWMVGHCHRDLNDKIASDDGTADINVVSTNCDNYNFFKSAYWGGLPMEAGTATEQAFDFVQINTAKHEIYLTRIGAGENRVLTY